MVSVFKAHPLLVDVAVYHFETGSRSSSCQHYNLQLFPHIFPFMDRRHGSDAWPPLCARFRALEPCAWSVPNLCPVLADQTTVHLHRFHHTCGHFLLPIRAIVACAHLQLQPIRCILPHAGKRKRFHKRRPTQSDMCLIKACSHSRAGSIGGQTSPSVKLYCTSNTAKCLCLPFERKRMNESKLFTTQIRSRALTYL